MGSVVSFNSKKFFTLEEAREILPVIYRLTEEANGLVKTKMNQINSIRGVNSLKTSELQVDIEGIIQKWTEKVEKLGASVKGVWVADFDSGNGYYCWKFPEIDIAHFHKYEEGFTGRTPLL